MYNILIFSVLPAGLVSTEIRHCKTGKIFPIILKCKCWHKAYYIVWCWVWIPWSCPAQRMCQNAPDNSQFATRIKTSRIPTCYYKACHRVRALLLLLTFFYFLSFFFFLFSCHFLKQVALFTVWNLSFQKHLLTERGYSQGGWHALD